MADHSTIEWTDATWNPVTGCSVVSPGCTNCYAMKLAGTRLRNHPSRAGLTVESKAGSVWNGQVRLNEEWLDQPLRWKRARRIFVCAHGDLFHEAVPEEWIDRVFAVMALAPQHTFQVLTKRSERMREYLNRVEEEPHQDTVRRVVRAMQGLEAPLPAEIIFPLPNVWLGVSAERQQEADERIPDLLDTPAAVRFLSAEPLLGEIDLLGTLARWQDNPERRCAVRLGEQLINWVIVGGENGPRPMHPAWARQLRDQCATAGIAFFFKQWGSWLPWAPEATALLLPNGCRGHVENVDDWPEGAVPIANVGRTRAGRMLDGRLHDGFPEVCG